MSRTPNTINGKKVVDATYRMAVHVTPEDIKKGDPRQHNSCAVARACIRDFDALGAHVSLTRAYIEFPKKIVRFNVPPSLRNEIVAFDQGGKFTPDTYVMIPPCKSQALGKPQKRNPPAKRRQRAKQHHPMEVRSMSNVFKEWIKEGK